MDNILILFLLSVIANVVTYFVFFKVLGWFEHHEKKKKSKIFITILFTAIDGIFTVILWKIFG